MNFFLFDASALVKRYYAEIGAVLVDQLFARVTPDRLACLMLGAAEVAAALVRKRNGGLITPSICAAALARLRSEILAAVNFSKLAADNALIEDSISLLDRHPINSSDAVLLQAALGLASQLRAAGQDLVLVASDQRLLSAARTEGLLTFNPETETQNALDVLIGP